MTGTVHFLHTQVLNTLCCRPELHLVSVDDEKRKRLCVSLHCYGFHFPLGTNMQSQFLQTCTKERAESEVPKLAGTTPSGIPCANAAAAGGAMDTDGQALVLQIPMHLLFKKKKPDAAIAKA